MIAKDNLPLNTCEKEGFKYLMKTVAPLYQMPGRKKITDLIDDKYDVLSSIFKKKLADIPNVTLTSDVWTETMTTKSFLGVTCHFLLEKQLTSLTIGVFELYERHTSQYLGERISSICEEWNIVHSKVTAVVTDNGANIVKTVNDIFGKNKQLSCFGHTLDLVASKVTDDIPDINDIINRVKAIVTYFKQSVSAADDLRKAQSPDNVLKLIQSVPTRWNSKFYMLERFVKLCDYVTPILLKNPKSPSIIGAADLEIIKDVLNILGPLEAVSKEMCGEKYLTSSKVIPIVKCLLKKLESLSPTSESETALELKKITILELSKRFGTIEQVKLLAVSSILDPRFKKLHFNSPVACANAVNFINQSIQLNRQKKISTSSNQSQPNTNSRTDPNIANPNFNSVWAYHEELAKQYSEKQKNATSTGDLELDLKMYLNSPTIGLDLDPFDFWSNCCCSTELKEVAYKYLSVVGSSVPSERIFSKAGRIITETRNRLTGERLSKLLFLNSLNFKDWNF